MRHIWTSLLIILMLILVYCQPLSLLKRVQVMPTPTVRVITCTDEVPSTCTSCDGSLGCQPNDNPPPPCIFPNRLWIDMADGKVVKYRCAP
jgi:hypothetical protein